MSAFLKDTLLFAAGMLIGGIIAAHIGLHEMDRQQQKSIRVMAEQNATIDAQRETISQQQTAIDNLTAELTKWYAQAGADQVKRQAQAQAMLLTDVRLNQCEVAAKKLAAQQAELPSGAQSAVAMLLKAFLR